MTFIHTDRHTDIHTDIQTYVRTQTITIIMVLVIIGLELLANNMVFFTLLFTLEY